VIFIDTREQYKEFVEQFLKQQEIPNQILTLAKGMDYMITGDEGTVGIQRKTFGEMCSQMPYISDEIIPALMELTENPILLIEEDFKIGNGGLMWRKEGNFLKETSITAFMYFNFLNRIRSMGCDVVITASLTDSCWWMLAMQSWLDKKHYPKPKKRYGADMQALGILCCINNFGTSKGTKLLKEYTIRELLQLPDKTLVTLLTKNQHHNFSRVFDTKME
jgi:ERCC4-type nuclease